MMVAGLTQEIMTALTQVHLSGSIIRVSRSAEGVNDENRVRTLVRQGDAESPQTATRLQRPADVLNVRPWHAVGHVWARYAAKRIALAPQPVWTAVGQGVSPSSSTPAHESVGSEVDDAYLFCGRSAPFAAAAALVKESAAALVVRCLAKEWLWRS